jgi:hypothetical protein
MTKAHYHRQFNFALDSVDDADIIERIASQSSKIAYLRDLIRRDMRAERENDSLRELVLDMAREHECCYIAWPATIIDRMRELGIEVDE